MIKVAAYCRVSTDSGDQANSFESQQRYFKEYIERNPEWELTEIYADKGLSGTSTEKRAAFRKMINDAELGFFSLILTKEVSRFARNTVDTLHYARYLKSRNIGIYFITDNIRTLDPDAEFRLTIMASIAQEESRKTSERVKWGQRRQMEQGVVFGRSMLGYDAAGGKLYINRQGAEIVRLIFHKFAEERKGTYTIARELSEAGYKTVTGNTVWTNTVILKALRNEKYCGDLVQKKTYTPDFLTHQKKYNKGQEDFVVIKNHHEPIISRELWQKAQEELDRRSPNREFKNKHSNRYPLSGKIFCGQCGNHFVSRARTRRDGSRYKAWRCYEAARHGAEKTDTLGNRIGCGVSSQISDEDLMSAVKECVKRLQFDKEKAVNNLCGIIENVLSADELTSANEIEKQIESCKLKIDRLLDLYASADLTKDEYKEKRSVYDGEIKKLRESVKAAECSYISYEREQLIKSVKAKIKAMVYGDETDDTFYKNILDKIIVHSRESIEIFLLGAF
ncbi:MAG: recombinase family protein [Firmicutes bacterium]|nr:recombinase family protein [Bacillota bacterium]